MATFSSGIRRGLPRVPGGAPWPTGGERAAPAAGPTEAVPAGAVPNVPEPAAPAGGTAAAGSGVVAAPAAVAPVIAPEPSAARASAEGAASGATVRRGLPRVPGGEPWPPSGARAVLHGTDAADASAIAPAPAAAHAPAPAAAPVPAPAPDPTPTAAHPPTVAESPVAAGAEPDAQTGASAWIRRGILLVLGAIAAAGIVVLAARGVTTLPGVPEFLERYHGTYELPEFVDPGFPAWARWSHFLNFFFMILIVKTGLQVRYQRKPPAFFTPKRGGAKISLTVWMHTSLDVLWLLNGVVFVVLLFVSGHWARIVPTSWEVVPNAASAMLQYLTLEWPVEDGWVNFNSLQQLMYFLVVFVAAPLAALTGIRMSEWWPKDAATLNRIYPSAVARAVHFPTMAFFVLFTLVHVFLVLSTGMLKNLGHMFAGTPDGGWAGFWWFVAAIVVSVAAVWALRPMLVAPIAGRFGAITNR